ncbi:MAG TPA: pyruvate formate-lyase-activating protein [Dongiaceae bacterium]|nr:pyruvate formate-lyase-activating protein [Dongiaceae bacterium]
MSLAHKMQYPPLQAKSPFELRGNWAWSVPDSEVRAALASGEMGFLHSFITGSAVDGPGVRVVAWTTGCQFRCLYCHNPDTWNLSKGIPITLDKAITELRRYRHGLKTMAGGFTLSGGEPLMQDRFAVKLLGAAREMGIHTALDTNGSLGHRLSDQDLDVIDLILLDIKCWNPDLHRRLTGMDVAPVLDFARRLSASRRSVWLRYVLVPQWTDTMTDIAQLAEFVAGLGNVERIDVLPFHQMGRFKWKELKLNYELHDLQPPSAELVRNVCEQFRARGLSAF